MVETRKTRTKTNQQVRKPEDENQSSDTSEETVDKKDNKKVYCAICEKESSGAHKCSVCDQFVHVICGSYSKDSESFRLKITCNLCVRKNRINIERDGAKSGQEQKVKKNCFSLQLKTSSS